MKHRHLNTQGWTAAAIASALERGGLEDWRELFAAVRSDAKVAMLVERVAGQIEPSGAAILAWELVQRMRSKGHR